MRKLSDAALSFRRTEWLGVALIVIAIVAVNKLVVHDKGSDWPGLLTVSFWVGVGGVQLGRRLTTRS